MKKYNGFITISILGIVLMALSLYEEIGLVRTFIYSICIATIFGCAEGMIILKQIRGDKMSKNSDPIITMYLILIVVGGSIAIASFIGELSVVQNIMFGIGFGLVVSSLFLILKKGNG